ncbi:MAG: hypothetical protein JRI97_04900 [Deltaproteobacteria bacterium]|nr:hypothetical protein [Deltaproteobacteria bacterium]
MEERIRRLEERLRILEREVEDLQKRVPAENVSIGSGEGDEGAFEAAYRKLAQNGKWVRIHALRKSLGWEAPRFDQVLESLWSSGRAELMETEEMLSIRQMGDSYPELFMSNFARDRIFL